MEERLTELGLDGEDLREAVRAGLLESLACTEYDPVSARGYELWRMTSRRLREVTIVGPDPDWRAVDERNQPLVVNPGLKVAVTVSSGNDLTGNCDVERPPSTRNPKGQATADLIRANEQLVLFPKTPSLVPTPKKSERATWVLLVWASGSSARCELSLPMMLDHGYIVDWRERLMLEPITLDEIPFKQFGDTGERGVGPFDVPITRKRGA